MTERIINRKMRFEFKEEFSYEQRKAEATNIRLKYPDRAPVIIEKVEGSNIDVLDKRKFLVPSDLSIGQLIWIIRKRIKLPSEKALYIYVQRTVPSTSISVGEVYEEYKDEDGFLYMNYSGENTFGESTDSDGNQRSSIR